MTEIRLFPTAPYDFHISAAIFSGGAPAIRTYDKGIYRHTLDIEEKPFLIALQSEGDPEMPELSCSVFPDPGEAGIKQESVITLISSIFNIYDDLRPFYRHIEGDEVLSGITRKLNGLKAPTTPTVFEALVDSVIEQQISLKVAHSLQNRLIKAVGKQLMLDNSVFFCYPTPAVLSETPPEVFRECGMTLRKGEYIRGISRAIISGDLDLEKFRRYDDTDTIIEEMMNIRGVGKWTAELTILRGIHKLDAFPADDVALRRIMARYYTSGQPVSASQARDIAAGWGKWKGLAAFYLEIADLLKRGPQ
jgi:DNA-3-methyladenine glycosylase II